ncbi:MAG TPA: hypothetical protein VG797_08105 [Phycisphaerales bacterium]|nr:hypothetical protein [Phycisphaerales bacterium]
MPDTLSRRGFLIVTPAAGLGVIAANSVLAGESDRATCAVSGPTSSHFPAQDPALVKEVVGLSHRSLEGVRKLVERQPTLAKAAWDWGFGDWETALGAASHTGQREIALYLIEHGARPDIFTFAMLGNLEAVKAMVTGSPGIQRLPGPHGIPLLAHAEAGDEAAKPVFDYLSSLGDAGIRYQPSPLSEEEVARYIGVYSFGTGATDRVEVKAGKKTPLTLERAGGSALNLFYKGNGEFHPPGAPAVRIRFVMEGERAARVEFLDPDLYLAATRQ